MPKQNTHELLCLTCGARWIAACHECNSTTWRVVPATVTIYALRDPVKKQLFYVGQTMYPKTRLYQHMSGATSQHGLQQYIRMLKKNNTIPDFVVLELCRYTEANTKEKEWITRLRATEPLVNTKT